ncbi:hypothetical protein [Mucilaginibacter celer]|uniref:hypothetical protein n=1 Tax=Mucilaginibacter celer TaxID=2305508 RepID=UPI001FDFE41C|nr:hypothetical protein [Mucilaginibacter celer]
MIYFIQQLKFRKEALFYFSAVCLLSGIIFLVLSQVPNIRVMDSNAWSKPAKFALSICLYVSTKAWFVAYLTGLEVRMFNYAVILLLGFELVYIAVQAGRGQLSHYNMSTTTYAVLFRLMGIAAAFIAL